MDDQSRYRWIATNILPYEAELRGWLRRRVRALQDNEIDDLVQEAFARIWASDLATIRNGRAYFFATVRHLLAEYARRRRIVPIELLGEIESLNLISEEPGLERQVGARQELARLKAIVAALPAQCRKVFELCKLDGLSYRQAASRMGLSEKTVENHLGRALARITDSIARSETEIAKAPPQSKVDAGRETISELAARWAVRSVGTLTAAEQRELNAWLDADPRHRGAYVRARAQWFDLDRLAALHGPADILDEPAPMSRRYWLAASVAAVTALGGGLSWLALRDESERLVAGIGEVRRIPLADGSTLLLNTDTEVLVKLTATRRDVELRRGEALFEVAHDKSRPFVVRANATAVRAVGTAFAVRLQSEQIDVTVTEGVVELSDAASDSTHSVASAASPPSRPQRVSANERAVILPAVAPAVSAIPAPQLSRQLAWRDGMVSFDGETLQMAANEINRHNRRQIVVDDATLAQRPLVGVFRATDVEGFAQAAAATLKARVVITDERIRLEPE